jgi:hypothetical protein
MKTISTHLILMLLPIITFIILFYLIANAMSGERRVSDISSQIMKVMDEAEILKIAALEKIKRDRNGFTIFGSYCILKVNVTNISENEIFYEIEVRPKEKLEGGIELVLYTSGNIKI